MKKPNEVVLKIGEAKLGDVIGLLIPNAISDEFIQECPPIDDFEETRRYNYSIRAGYERYGVVVRVLYGEACMLDPYELRREIALSVICAKHRAGKWIRKVTTWADKKIRTLVLFGRWEIIVVDHKGKRYS